MLDKSYAYNRAYQVGRVQDAFARNGMFLSDEDVVTFALFLTNLVLRMDNIGVECPEMLGAVQASYGAVLLGRDAKTSQN